MASDTEANIAEHWKSSQKRNNDRCATVLWPQTMLKCLKQLWLRCFNFWRESHDNLSCAVNITAETQIAASLYIVPPHKICALIKNRIIAVQAKKAYKIVGTTPHIFKV
jgi:hypothetical protein